MDYVRIAKLHNEVFCTPQGSKEREQAINSLSDSERKAVFNLEKDYMLGRITRKEIAEMAQKGNGAMPYQQYKNKMESDKKGTMQEISQFAMKNPETYRQYRERYVKEQDDERILHNRRLAESTFKNKPYFMR